MKGKVAVVKTRPETVLEDIERVMKMADFEQTLDKSSTTILKDNISWHFPMPGANTTPWQLEGVTASLRNNGFNDVVAVENKTVVTRPEKGRTLNKFDRVYDKYHIPILLNFDDKDMKWVKLEPKSKMRVLNHIYPEGIYIPDYFVGKNIVQLPTMKCHIYTTTTGAMKNAFGGLLNTRRHYTHSWIHETLVDLLKIQHEIHSGVFAVMDGTTSGSGPGPRTLIPVQTDYMLASADQVAIDAVSARMMGFDPMKIDYIRIAHEEGLGIGKPSEIQIVGEDVERVNLNFSVGDNLASTAGDILWFGPLKQFQKFFFHTPLVNLFVLASDVYHDRVWWPSKGDKTYREWLQNSPWGRLFERY